VSPGAALQAWLARAALGAASLVAALPAAAAAAGCKAAPVDPLDAATSPQAQAEPAPLAAVPATQSSVETTPAAGAGPPPEPLRGDTELPADTPHELVRELVREPGRDAGLKEVVRDAKELAGYELTAVVHTGEGPPAPKVPEVNSAGIEAAKRKTEAHLTIDASQTRARLVLSGGFVLPPGTQLRARVDRYGHLVVWPGEDTYRIAEPGALRALVGERRLDVAPLSPARVASPGEGARRLNLRTRRVDVTTRAASATFELATLREAGDGGVLVCRLLLDLMSAPPSTPACEADEVPLHAELRWETRGSLVLDVTSIARRTDLPPQEMAAPPPTSRFVRDPPPLPPGEALLSKADLAALRSGPADVPPAPRDAGVPPPEAGLLLVNASDELRVAWIDGVAAAWVAPGGRELLASLLRGRYTLQWRTALGDAWTDARTVDVPGASEIGSPE
jgi:hypothetical protein